MKTLKTKCSFFQNACVKNRNFFIETEYQYQYYYFQKHYFTLKNWQKSVLVNFLGFFLYEWTVYEACTYSSYSNSIYVFIDLYFYNILWNKKKTRHDSFSLLKIVLEWVHKSWFSALWCTQILLFISVVPNIIIKLSNVYFVFEYEQNMISFSPILGRSGESDIFS